VYDQVSFIKGNRNIEFVNNGTRYYVNFLDYRLKGDVSPLEREREKIEGIIINKRVQHIRKNIRKLLYDDALSTNEAKRYDE
ncbi:MAG: hypothetical protein MRY83_10220, partial [Flavobacteriales bacterium]|nr:hypothetical protein [Flavobacteriales bacterium]